jgi:hypothetical protein
MTGAEAFLAMAEWADSRAEHWQNEMNRHQALVGGSMHRIRHHGASRMAAHAMNNTAMYREVAAEARRRASEEEQDG